MCTGFIVPAPVKVLTPRLGFLHEQLLARAPHINFEKIEGAAGCR
jgi:hypothetical protein